MRFDNVFNTERLGAELDEVCERIERVKAVIRGKGSYVGPVPSLSSLLRERRDLEQRISLATFPVKRPTVSVG